MSPVGLFSKPMAIKATCTGNTPSGLFNFASATTKSKLETLIQRSLGSLSSSRPPRKSEETMPSLQAALPPELANNVIRLYRECLRRAKYIGHQQHNTELLVDMVRQQFKRNKHETDPEKIQKLKDDAARGLINHILYESERLSGRKLSKST